MILLNPEGNINLHTHTHYCDGKDSLEELAAAGFELGMKVLGFSGHENSPLEEEFCMSREDTQKYREDALRLKSQYKGKMEILLGIERDFFSPGDDYPYDYVIGSVHILQPKDGVYLTVDHTAEKMEQGVEKYFGGSYRKYAECFFETSAHVVEKTHADIIGHFDLLTKFNEGGKYFDEEAQWYQKATFRALAQIVRDAESAGKKPVFEINTGAMARGYRRAPYPNRFILKELERLGVPVILGSDCHDKRFLNFYFEGILKSGKKIKF